MRGFLRSAVVGASLVLLLGSVLPASASEFEYSLGEFGPGTGLCAIGGLDSGIDVVPVGGSAAATYPATGAPSPSRGTTAVSAFAERGRVRAYAEAEATLDPPYNSFVYGGCARADLTLDDIVVSGPGGLQSASLNLEIVGSPSGDYAPPPGFGAVRLDAIRPDQVIRSTTMTNFTLGVTPAALTTGAVDFMAGDTFRVVLWLQVNGRVVFTAPGSKSAVVDFASLAPVEYGAHLPLSGPVLNLPPGHSVDSIDGNIVDNQYLGASAPSAVPALGPVGAGLLALALAAGACAPTRRIEAWAA